MSWGTWGGKPTYHTAAEIVKKILPECRIHRVDPKIPELIFAIIATQEEEWKKLEDKVWEEKHDKMSDKWWDNFEADNKRREKADKDYVSIEEYFGKDDCIFNKALQREVDKVTGIVRDSFVEKITPKLKQILDAIPKSHAIGLRIPLRAFIDSDIEKIYPGFSHLLNWEITYKFPETFRHTHIVGGTGSGKTQLLQQLLSISAKSTDAIIVIDSQGDLLNKLKRTPLIESSRLVIIDPTDCVRHPLALNMFDVGDRDTDPVEYERQVNNVIGLLSFVFSSMFDSELTDKQSVLLNFCLRLMLRVPKATVYTLLELLEGSNKYDSYVKELPELAQQFFSSAFKRDEKKKNEYDETKEQVKRRIFTLLENGTIGKIIGATETRLHLGKEMQAGKVILISTDKSFLSSKGTEFIGRYFFALIAQATQQRIRIPEHQRRPCHVYIDEIGDYFTRDDENIRMLLEQGRKYKVSLTLAHQQLDQIPKGVYECINTNTMTKYASNLSYADKSLLQHEMPGADFPSEKLNFACYVKGETKKAFNVRVVPGIIENAGRRTDEEMEAIMERNRELYCVQVPQKQTERIKTSNVVIHETSKTRTVEGTIVDDEDDFESFNKI